MRVQLKDTLALQTNLSFDQNYIVFEIESAPSGDTYYRIENDANRLFLMIRHYLM